MAKILLIDDDAPLRTVLREALTHFGHSVVEARDGREGLQLFSQTSPDLVITDILMPEKEGLEVLMELRKNPVPVKIIAISGGGSGKVEYLRVARLMGASAVLAKPFTIDVLIKAVNALV